jgi:hypothetical protein
MNAGRARRRRSARRKGLANARFHRVIKRTLCQDCSQSKFIVEILSWPRSSTPGCLPRPIRPRKARSALNDGGGSKLSLRAVGASTGTPSGPPWSARASARPRRARGAGGSIRRRTSRRTRALRTACGSSTQPAPRAPLAGCEGSARPREPVPQGRPTRLRSAPRPPPPWAPGRARGARARTATSPKTSTAPARKPRPRARKSALGATSVPPSRHRERCQRCLQWLLT